MFKKKNRRGSSKVSVYANLGSRRRVKADLKAREKAEYLASLPKQPLKRFLYRISPRQVFHYWFSKRGAFMALKLLGVFIICGVIFIAAMFAYYRKELSSISPSELSKRVQTTVTRYYDRNGVLLWEDKGSGDYKLVVNSQDIAPVMKQAMVAIEDKDFYKNSGVSVSGIIRAALHDLGGGSTQGASTLTQQLIKVAFFSNTEAHRTISQKIKEAVLAIEASRMYTKDQILTMYLNSAPFGGRRDGVESAAQTYFGVDAKDLTLPQAALLAAIPQIPSYYDPYYTPGNQDLITRQHQVLDDMQKQGYITAQQAADAKKIDILSTIKPELSGNEDIKAPHFVLEVRSQLEQKFGESVVRSGGLIVKTTLDYRLQQIAENAVSSAYSKYISGRNPSGPDNIAFTAVDVTTGQVLAMVGSYNYNDPNYGAVNAATALLQPGSSIKIADYSALFTQKSGQNYGAGSILSDSANVGKQVNYGSALTNYNGSYMGNMTARKAFANSRNPPAVEAAYISGINNVVNLARSMGDTQYCQGIDYGLSAAIGACDVTLAQHTNAYATLGHDGIAEPESYVLLVQNAQGQTLEQWQDQGKRVLDPQIPYIVSDILSDPNARTPTFYPFTTGMYIPGVKTASKTGTTDNGSGLPKDDWLMSYSPKVAAGVWVGRHDGQAMPASFIDSPIDYQIMHDFMLNAHTQVFQKDGTWKPGDWFSKPAGIQTLNVNGSTDIYPSWYNKNSGAGTQMTFDKVSKKKATNCTPEGAKDTVTVTSTVDPITNQTTYDAPNGYDPTTNDDAHNCNDIMPFVTSLTATPAGSKGTYSISATVSQGTFPLQSITFSTGGQTISTQQITGPGTYTTTYTFSNSGSQQITATVTDQGYYTGSANQTVTVTVSDTGAMKNLFAEVLTVRAAPSIATT